ncbi:MAG: hypothetical protein ACK56I_14470, partial [bacterium]
MRCVSAGMTPGPDESNRRHTVRGVMTLEPRATLASRAGAPSTDLSSASSSVPFRPRAWLSAALISSGASNSASWATRARTAIRLTSSAEITFHSSMRPSSLVSRPQR